MQLHSIRQASQSDPTNDMYVIISGKPCIGDTNTLKGTLCWAPAAEVSEDRWAM